MVQWANVTATAATSAITAAATLETESEKLGSLKICGPIAVAIASAWTFYYLRKDLFPADGIAYMALVATSYLASAVSMNTLNKVCVFLTGAASTVTLIQMAITVVVTLATQGREVLGADRKKLFYWMAVPIMFAGMLNSSLLGYKYLTLSLVTVFRNLTPLMTLMVEGLIMSPEHKPKVNPPIVMSLLVMVVGAVIFSYGQVNSTWLGFCIIFLNTLLAMGDRLLQRRLLVAECKDLPLSACMTVNNTLGMLPTLAMAMAMHEADGYRAHSDAWQDPSTLVLIALSGGMGLCIGFFGLMCQKAVTATSFLVLQSVSKIGVVAVGVSVFGDNMDSRYNICGMALSLLGSAAYGFARASESAPASADAAMVKGEKQALLPKELESATQAKP